MKPKPGLYCLDNTFESSPFKT